MGRVASAVSFIIPAGKVTGIAVRYVVGKTLVGVTTLRLAFEAIVDAMTLLGVIGLDDDWNDVDDAFWEGGETMRLVGVGNGCAIDADAPRVAVARTRATTRAAAMKEATGTNPAEKTDR